MLVETKTRRSPRIQVRMPLVLLWSENGEERTETFTRRRLAGSVARSGAIMLFPSDLAYKLTARARPLTPPSYTAFKTKN